MGIEKVKKKNKKKVIRTNPKLWESVKKKVTRGSKGGKPGQWSARKAQLAVAEYKKKGGGYGKNSAKPKNTSLGKWTRQKWGTKSGKNSDEFATSLLQREHVATMPGSSFGEQAKDFIRMSLTVPDKDLRDACRRMIRFVSKCNGG